MSYRLSAHPLLTSPIKGEELTSRPDEPSPPPLVGGDRGGGRQGDMKTRPTQRARALRRQATDAEKLLWRYLRAKQLGGAKFRRQEPIGKYIGI